MRETCACGASIEAKLGSDLMMFRLGHQHVEPTPPTQGPRLQVTVKVGHMPRRLRRWQR